MNTQGYKFNVTTDETFYMRFVEAKERLTQLSNIFQNFGVIVTEDELWAWNESYNALIEELEEIRFEAQSRFSIK